jgi:protein-tyrosine-phosphatase
MLITFVCNQNLARSQVLSSVFSKLYPEHEFQSAGLIAIEGNELPLVVQEIFQDWGLPLTSQKARNLIHNFSQVRKSDIIFSINESISREIHALGFTGTLVQLDEVAKQLGLILKDPQLMPRQKCATELAKYIRVVGFVFRTQFLVHISKPITALTPETELNRSQTLEVALTNYYSNSTIIMADFLVPQIDLLSGLSVQTSMFDINSHTSEIRIRSSGGLREFLIPANPALWPARTYLSYSWRKFCEQGSQRLTTIITPPSHSGLKEIAESHLSAVFADRVEVVATPIEQ